MRKSDAYLFLLLMVMSSCTTQQITQVLNDYLEDDKPTTFEVSSGLKEALVQGITKGANSASATDGYFGNPLIK